MRWFRKRRERLAFDVDQQPTELAETLGDVAVPVGHSLKVWQEPNGPAVEFELVRIEAQSGDPALARFIAKRGMGAESVIRTFRS